MAKKRQGKKTKTVFVNSPLIPLLNIPDIIPGETLEAQFRWIYDLFLEFMKKTQSALPGERCDWALDGNFRGKMIYKVAGGEELCLSLFLEQNNIVVDRILEMIDDPKQLQMFSLYQMPIIEDCISVGKAMTRLKTQYVDQVNNVIALVECIKSAGCRLTARLYDAAEPSTKSIEIGCAYLRDYCIRLEHLINQLSITAGINIHIAGDRSRVEGEWSKPMSKTKMMAALGIDSPETFKTFSDNVGIKKIKHKTYMLRLDTLSPNLRERIEKL